MPRAPSLPRLPPAPAPPPSLTGEEVRTFADRVRERQADALRARDCDAPRDAYDIRRHDDAHPLDADHVLVFVACYSGAYQTASMPFRVARADGAAEAVVLPSPPGLDAVVAASGFTLLTNAGYVPATGTLSHLAKGRGLGDCGEAATWRYDGQAFHLASYAALRRCGGGVYRLRLIHGYRGGTAIRDMLWTVYNKRSQVKRMVSISEGVTELVLREY